ncbi:hypothetical protein HNY73_001047 [Argiope bruennichi]|uniref:Bro-N domain-containing protein n=1 Tax=Argiope bruennichi TaxID=94029 RepID=A0A8T0G0B0_ARGBR|nr:hypothetical protein HNY73_001047 [Argiope bruennichi]
MAGNSFYIKDNVGNENYSYNNDGSQYYAKSNDKTKIFAKKANGEPFYAKNKTGEEFYPIINNIAICITKNNGLEIYAKTPDGNEIYPTILSKSQYGLRNEYGQYYYAKDKYGNEIYPKNLVGDEFRLSNKYAFNVDGQAKYPITGMGRPIYPKDATGKEIYEILDINTGEPIYGKGVYNEYYAKDQFNNDYYLVKNTPNGQLDVIAKDDRSFEIYAVTNNGKIIYPKNIDGDEIYLTMRGYDQYRYLKKCGTSFDYAKRGNKEIYPLHTLNFNVTEMYLNNRYAKNANGKEYYPRDECGNEFLIDFSSGKTESEIFINGYPITMDSFYIVPNINDKAYLLSNVVSYFSNMETLSACMDNDGVIFWKASEIASLLGYKKPAEVIRTHILNALTLDVLINKDNGDTDQRIIPFPTNSKMITEQQIRLLLSKITRPYSPFQAWFSKIMNRPLKSSIELNILQNTDHKIRCLLPIFTMDCDGDIKLKNLKQLLNSVDCEPSISSEEIKTDIIDEFDDTPREEKTTRTISTNTMLAIEPVVVMQNKCSEYMTKVEEETATSRELQESNMHFIDEPLKCIVIDSVADDGIPLNLYYETQHYRFEFRRFPLK